MIPLIFSIFVPISAFVIKRDVAFNTFSLTLSQSTKELVKLKIVFLNFYAVPVKSVLLTVNTNFNLGVLLNVR